MTNKAILRPVIGLVLFPDATQLDLAAPYEVFARIPNAQIQLIAHDLEPVKTERGLKIVPDTTYEDCPPLDVLFIPGGPGQIKAESDKKLMAFIVARAAEPGSIVSSVCTGALLLGAAGVLRGKQATTHWTCLDMLPFMGAIPVDRPVVEAGRIITGAGVTNGIDLALRVAERLCGKDAAEAIARQIEYPHASHIADKKKLAALDKTLLARNPYRQARLEAARRTAEWLNISPPKEEMMR